MNSVVFLLLPPLLSFVAAFFFGRRLGDRFASVVSVAGVLLSFLLTVYFLTLLAASPDRVLTHTLYPWFDIAGIQVTVSFVFDRLSALFCLLITGIGFFIHVYSLGYMKPEQNTFRFFSYLSLFIFFMLLLVLADSLLLAFMGWEGVGLASYLLIGYYGHKASAGNAAQKAFVMNRIGDFGFLIAVFTAGYLFSSFSFDVINASGADLLASNQISTGMLEVFLLAVFFACTGKSAQIPLYTWLLDAMEAPTPVSALIHAATMVTAGIYLIARLHAVFVLSPAVLSVILYVGAFTALIAAFIAVAQTDIKRILAFSTVSQLGYMFMALGVGAFEVGLFHMVTHAFFKALLFLGAGSVIYSLHHEQDIRKMGALASALPKTSFCFAVATYSIAGLPLSAGFFSKDEILWKVFDAPNGSAFIWFVGLFTAGLTAYYMYRLYFRVFHSKPTVHIDLSHVKEAPFSMILPLQVFAVFAAFGGFLGMPNFLNPFSDTNFFHNYFAGFFQTVSPVEHHREFVEWSLLGVTFIVASCGTFIAWYVYSFKDPVEKTQKGIILTLAENRLYVDRLYNAVVILPLQWIGTHVFKNAGEFLVTVSTDIIGDAVSFISQKNKEILQSGKLSLYLLLIFGSITAMLFLAI